MGILDEDVTRVKEQTDLVALIGEHVALKRSGQRFSGLCPFHAEKTPSFSVNPELGFYYCLAGETRVITWDGVREIRQLAGTTQRVLTTKGQWVDAPFSSFGVQQLMRITLGRNGVEKVLYATPEHRWFIRTEKGRRSERTTRELRRGHALSWTFPQRALAHGTRLSPFGIARGITYGDGSRFAKGACVDLHGRKDAELLKWFPLSHSYQCERIDRQGRRHTYLRVVDLPAYFKERPSLDESASYLIGWLAGYLAADGHVSKDGTVMLHSADRDDLEFVRLLCLRVGIGTYGITEQQRTGLGESEPSSLYRLHFIGEDLTEDFLLIDEHRRRFSGSNKAWHRRGWVVKSVEECDRVEEVFCATVEGSHAFALEDNILTGNCFGCQASGDAITFLREVEHLDFAESVERLAARSGITLRYDDKRVSEDRKRKDRLIECVEAAVTHCHELLLTDNEAGTARKAIRDRGFDGDVARRFRLGYAPGGWDALAQFLGREGFSRRDIIDAGLAFVNKANRLQDHLRGRLLFPIFDREGHAVGFGGRALGDDGPKYKNTGETPIYHKSSLLYGLNWAKADIVSRDQVVLCEGYTDVIAFHLAGVTQAVATCGTSLTDDHFRILKNLSRTIVLAYDADAAGQAAAEKCYRWEQQFEMQFSVASLPSGRDPAEVWQDDHDALPGMLDNALPLLQFRLDRRLAEADTSSLEGRARSAEHVAELVAEHPSDLVRDQYVVKLSDRLDIDADRLRATVEEARRRPRKPDRGNQRTSRVRTGPSQDSPRWDEPPGNWDDTGPPDPDEAPRAPDPDRVEMEALRWAVHDPATVADLLDAEVFRTDAARAVLAALASATTFDEAVSGADPSTAALLTRLAVEEPWAPAAVDDQRSSDATEIQPGDASSPIAELRAVARRHAPDIVDISHSPRSLAVGVVSQLVEERAGRLLATLTRDDHDRAMQLREVLEELREARRRDDSEAREAATLRLVAWVRESATTTGDS